jgi:sortase A
MSIQGFRRPRHRVPDEDETTLLPRIAVEPDADRTVVLPVISVAAEPAPQPVLTLPTSPPSPQAQADSDLDLGSGSGPDPDLDNTTVLPILASGPDRVVAPPILVPEPTPVGDPAPAPAPRRSIGVVARLVARSAGELLVAFGLVVLLLAAYELWGKGTLINDHQSDLDNQLAQQWGNPATGASPNAAPGAPPPGGAIGRMYIPKLKLHWVVVEGVGLADIRYAPGHYPGTAMPGQVGNFSVAGHREPGIFWDLDKVQSGDDVVLETGTNWYVYQVFQSHIVSPSAVEVVAPVPNEPGVAPTDENLTLTTCNPKWDNYQRMAVHAKLVATYPHSQRPGELGGA